MILNTRTDMFPLHTQDMTLYCLQAAMYDVYKSVLTWTESDLVSISKHTAAGGP